jgi:hypothetical protein
VSHEHHCSALGGSGNAAWRPGGLISAALALARKRPAVVSDIAERFPLKHVADAYRALEWSPAGKVLVIPGHDVG